VDEPYDILLVDDDEVDRAAVRRALDQAGVKARIVEASDAPEALQALAARSFDCVLLDYRLPKADGLTLLKQARQAGVASPAIMLTGQGDEATAVAIMRAGAFDYIAKGALSPDRLAQSLRQAVRLGRAEQRAVEAQAEAETQRARLSSLFMQAPVAIAMFEGAHQRCVLANDVYRAILGRRDLDGRSIREAAPDLADSGIFEIMEHVLSTGEPQTLTEHVVRLDGGNGVLEERFFDTTWQATRDGAGRILGVMSIGVEVTGQVRARRERERLYEQAQRAVRSRDDLLATVSHDLRSPLSAIFVTTSLLRRPESLTDAERVGRYAASIDRSARRMERLIRDLLDLAAMEDGQLSMDFRPHEVAALLADAKDVVQPVAQEKGITLVDHRADPDAWVRCDRDRIAQVFSNLIGNAIKVTPPQGSVSLTTQVHEGLIKFSISDAGPGIDPTDLPRVFDRFWQSKRRGKLGTGLGLAISQSIVAQHGSRLVVESTLGVGTTFSFTLVVETPAETRVV
jgi:signal transduction histidine kinase